MNETWKFILIIMAVLTPIWACMPGGIIGIILFWGAVAWYFGYAINSRTKYRKALKDMIKAGIITEDDLKDLK